MEKNRHQSLSLLLLLVLAFSLFQSSCDSSLSKVSKALLITSKTVGEIQTDVITANSQKLISDETTGKILEMCIKVNLAGKEATALTKNLSNLDVTSKAQILEILKPVITTLGDIIINDLELIKDEGTKLKIKGILVTLQTTLNSIQIVVSTGGA